MNKCRVTHIVGLLVVAKLVGAFTVSVSVVMLLVACRSVCLVLWIVFLLSATVSAGFFDKRNVLITKFKYELCDGRSYSRNPAWLRDVDVMTTAYGDLDVLGTLVTAVNLTAPVKASVSLRRKILGLYVPLPCIKEFGSCEYPDLCVYGYSENEECPPIFDEHDMPCRCPIKPGVYVFPGGQFRVPKTRWAQLLAGQYKGLVRFYERNRQLSCYKFYFTLE